MPKGSDTVGPSNRRQVNELSICAISWARPEYSGIPDDLRETSPEPREMLTRTDLDTRSINAIGTLAMGAVKQEVVLLAPDAHDLLDAVYSAMPLDRPQ